MNHPENAIKCRICAGMRIRSLWKKMPAGISTVQCRDCRLVFQAVPVEPFTLYDKGYYAHRRESGVALAKRATYAGVLKNVPLPADRHVRILDVGCAAGDSLDAIEAFGAEGWGVEYSEALRETVEKRWGDRVKIGEFEKISFPDRFFYAIGMIDVIEHFSEPFVVLERSYALLEPGGWLFLATPDYGSTVRKLLGPFWEQYKKDHVCYFTEKNLGDALRRIGFEVFPATRFRKQLHMGYFLSTVASQSPWLLPGFVVKLASQFYNFWNWKPWLPTDEFVLVARKKADAS